jgi:hypothetical protein
MADGQGSPRAEGSGPVSGTQITVSVGVLVGRLTDGAGDGALGEGATGGDGLNEGEGAGAHPASTAQSRAAANVFIVIRTLRVFRRLRKDRIGGRQRVFGRASVAWLPVAHRTRLSRETIPGHAHVELRRPADQGRP